MRLFTKTGFAAFSTQTEPPFLFLERRQPQLTIGNNSASVVADAYLSGLRGYDMETLWQAVVHGANAVHPEVNSTGRHGFEYYNK